MHTIKKLNQRYDVKLLKFMSTQMMTKVIAEYFKTQPVLKAWLFGSFAASVPDDFEDYAE